MLTTRCCLLTLRKNSLLNPSLKTQPTPYGEILPSLSDISNYLTTLIYAKGIYEVFTMSSKMIRVTRLSSGPLIT